MENENKENEVLENIGYCNYCYRVFPLDQLIEEVVWINGERREELFCSKEHAAYRQMGAEG